MLRQFIFLCAVFALHKASEINRSDLSLVKDEASETTDGREITYVEPREVTVEYTPESGYSAVRHYVGGHRQHGDRLLGLITKPNHYWWTKDVEVRVRYPKGNRLGHERITYYEMSVNQTSFQGRLAIVGGGLHQTYIEVIIYAYKTKKCDFSFYVYGY